MAPPVTPDRLAGPGRHHDVTCPSGRLPVPRASLGTFMRAPALDSAMQYLLILLVAVTMACGAAASVTISLAPAYVADNGEGY
jgi:hypothetical protein